MSDETTGDETASGDAPAAGGEPTQPGEAASATPGDTTTKSRSATMEVPRWLAAALAALLLLGAGFAIGWFSAPGGGDHHHDRFESPFGRQFPRGPGGQSPFGGGSPFGRQSPSGGQPRVLSRVFLGVSAEDAPNGAGATVANVVSGSPADAAGIKAGDVITAVDGSKITSASDLVSRISSHQPGDQVTVTYTRNGSSTDAKVKLGDRSAAGVPMS